MSVRDRRKLGVNFISVFKAAKEVMNDPEFEPGSRAQLSEAILERIINKSLPEARAADASVDWDAILEFITKLLPIIFEIITIFT